MDGIAFDRITKTVTRRGGRRHALRGLLGGALAVAATQLVPEAAARKKPRCKKLSQICTFVEPHRCCGEAVRIRSCEVPAKRACGTVQRCCTFEDRSCNPGHGHCDCCGDLLCTFVSFGNWRCQDPQRDDN